MFQSPYATRFTREGILNMHNRKPYRTKEQKALARKHAIKTKNGTYISPVQRNYHPEPK